MEIAQNNKLDAVFVNTAQYYQKYLEQGIDTLIECLKCDEYLLLLKALDELKFAHLSEGIRELERNCPPDQIIEISLVSSAYVGIGIIIMGENTEFPLHDHPGMAVTTKVLKGEVQRTTLDLEDVTHQFKMPKEAMKAKDKTAAVTTMAFLQPDATFKTDDIFNLTPVSNNIHAFKPVTKTVMIDIQTPNYDDKLRFCNYYKMNVPPSYSSKVVLEYLPVPPPMQIKFYQR